MKIQTILLVLLSCCSLTAYSAIPPTAGRLTIQATAAKGQSIKLSTPNLFTLTPTTLIDTKGDPSGITSLTVSLTQPIFTDLEIGQKRYSLLLSPGDDLVVNLPGQLTDPARFSGKGSIDARYLLGLSAIWQQYQMRGGKDLMQLDPVGFDNRLDSLQQAYSAFTKSFMKDNSVNKASQYLLQQKSRVQPLSYQLNYVMAQYNPSDTSSHSSLALSLKKAVEQVPFDDQLLAANLYDYGFLLSMYLQVGVYAPLVLGKSKADLPIIQQQLPLLADQQLNQAAYPMAVRTFLRARNLFESLRQGITSQADSLLTSVKKERDYARYEPAISQSYAKWQALMPGQAAPDFSGITPQGAILSLTNLRGKVVYVDVWATWCVPCREEFPQAKQLQKRFATNQQVALVYVSIDRDQAAWHKFLANDTDFKGVHINQPPGEYFDSLWKTYQLSSIPRYMLIDQEGKIVTVNAERPSSGKIANEIDRLLH